jgi:imidazolonepropionase-like amidohydrolase
MPFTPFGVSSPEEFEVMVKLGGMSEMDSIIAGTHNAAKALKIDSQVGTLQPNKFADILILEKGVDPLSDISALQKSESIDKVVLRGSLI